MIIDFLTENVKQGIVDESSRALSAETILADAIDEVRDESYASVVYDASGRTIDFFNADGDNIGSIDASDFVIDGMVENVSLNGNILTVSFNTDSGKQDIDIDLTQYFNPANYYTIQETDDAIEEQVASGISIANAYTDEAISHIDLSAYWTSAQTEQAISGVSERLEEVESVTSIALNELNDKLSGYTPTSGFATINGSAITEGGDIVIEGGGATYSAGTNIDITEGVISVTGITVPDVSNFVTSGDLVTVEEVVSVSVNKLADDLQNNYSTTSQMNTAIDNAIASESARTEATYLKEHQSLDAYWTSAQTEQAISGVEAQIPVVPTSNTAFTNDAGYITNSALNGYATEQWVENKGYLTEHQSLSDYSTTSQMNTAISGAIEDMATTGDLQTLKTEIEGEIPDVSNFVTSGDVETQITSKGYALSSSIPTATSELTNDSNYVVSTAITSIVKLTQSAYDALANKDNSVLYIIIN